MKRGKQAETGRSRPPRTREEWRRESRLRLGLYALSLLFILVWLCGYLLLTARTAGMEAPLEDSNLSAKETPENREDGRLPGDNTPAMECCYLTADEMEASENELILAALVAKANRIDNCTVTWYNNDTCNKTLDDPTYGITASGLPTVEGVTCAVDNSVIPQYADVFVEFSDGTIEQYWATDTGVVGNHVDIFEPDYDTCIQNGRQVLTVWWLKETGT